MRLGDTQIDVYSASLPSYAVSLDRMVEILSPQERTRAESFRFPHLRMAFIVRHALLRRVLAEYLDQSPARIEFDYGERGKPFVRGAELFFSMSHSAGMAVYAIGPERLIGVDVEGVRPIPDCLALAASTFSESESKQIAALPPAVQLLAFYNGWSRKEAYVKALGTGLGTPLDGFEVSLAPDQPAEIVAIEGDYEHARNWSLFDLQPAAGYVGALAVWGREWTVRNLPLPCLTFGATSFPPAPESRS
jgi:4'-phosphopantetheinyl transferase